MADEEKYEWSNLEPEEAVNAISNRDITKFPFGIFTSELAMGVGMFLWFASNEELMMFYSEKLIACDIDPENPEFPAIKDAVNNVFDEVRLEGAPIDETLKKLNEVS